MSQTPEPKLTYKHDLNSGKHRIVLYDAKGDVLIEHSGKTFEQVFGEMENQLSKKIDSIINSKPKESLRQRLKPSSKKFDGLFPILPNDWKRITEYDFTNALIGLITQAELGRIRGVSRQAIHQSAGRGDIEIFVWRDEKYIPFDTIAVGSAMYNHFGPPMVIYYSQNAKRKKPRRRFKETQ